MCGHRGHTEGELDQEWSTEVRMEKEPLDVAMARPGGQGSWVIYLTLVYGYKARGGVREESRLEWIQE